MNAIKHFFMFFGAGVVLFVACLLLRAEEKNFSLPPETARLKPGPGSELAAANCLLCHSADYISIQPRLTRTAWKAEVTKMQQRYGAPISTNNFDVLTDYFTKNYGKENPVPGSNSK